MREIVVRASSPVKRRGKNPLRDHGLPSVTPLSVDALNWSGTRIDTTGTPARFFAELERARLIVIERAAADGPAAGS
jgi:hypothetical protein